MRKQVIDVARRITSGLAMRQWFASPRFCTAIEIETINRCNGTCEFCPVNRTADPRPFAAMEDSLLERVLRDLQSHGYDGLLGIQSNNEPLMDKHIVERIALARRCCPKARIYVYTNGTLLTYERLLALLGAGVDRMVIDNYAEDLSVHPHLAEILQRLRSSPDASLAGRVKLSVVSPKAIRFNRGGQAPNKPAGSNRSHLPYLRMGCLFPFNQLVIRPTGDVSLCCQDALGVHTLGNAAEMTIDEIWYGPALTEVRRKLSEAGRRGIALCRECDTPPITRSQARQALSRLARGTIHPWRRPVEAVEDGEASGE